MNKYLHYSFFTFYLLLLFKSQISIGQTMNENVYRNKSNKMYWQNRKPFEGYWQQDIAYKIKANINERTNIIEAEQELTYWNNSPDTLTFLYFHLYQNAFIKGSYLQELHRANQNPIKNFGKYGQLGLGTTVSGIKDLIFYRKVPLHLNQ